MRTKLLILSAAALIIAGCNASANNQQKQSDNDQQAQTAQDAKKETKKMKVQELNVADFKQKVMDYDKHPNEWAFAGDKPAVIDFYATWCGPCKAEMPNIKNVYQKYAGPEFDVLSVAVWDKKEDTIESAKKQGIVWNQIIDAQRVPTTLYGIDGIPHIILFGPDGTIVKRDLRGDDIEAEVAKYVKPVK